MKISAFLLLCAGILSPSPGSGFPQPPDNLRFRRLSVEHGLSQSAVNAIVQDGKGFIWLGTQDGLNRYDGYDLVVYRHDERDSLSLAESYVTCLLVDSRGDLWVGTYNGGVHRYDGTRNCFERFPHDPVTGAGPGSNIIMDLGEDLSGNIWMASWPAGVDAYDPGTNRWQHFTHDASDTGSLADSRVRSLFVDGSGSVWAGTFSGVDRYDAARNRFEHYPVRRDGAPGETEDLVLSACEDREGGLWFGTTTGYLLKADPERTRLDRIPAEPTGTPGARRHEIMALLEDEEGLLWAATRGGGVLLLDRHSGSTATIRNRADDETSLSGDFAIALFKDNTGSVWVGIDGGGVNHYDPYRFKFSHLRHVRGDPASLSHSMSRGMCEDRRGDLWIGTAEGRIDRLRRGSGSLDHYRTEGRIPGIPGTGMVLSLLEDADGTLWAGTDGDGLNVFSPSRGAFCRFALAGQERERFGPNSIMALEHGRDGSLWLGTLGAGLVRLDPATGACITYRRTGDDAGQLTGNWIYALHEDRSGNIWIGTWGRGISVLDPVSGRFRTYQHDPGDPRSLAHNTVHDFHEDNRGDIWVGTMGGGLDRFHPVTGAFEHFTEADGLPNNVVYGILEDAGGNLWISTNRGVSCFDITRRSFRNYGLSDGLQSLEFNQGAFCRGIDGRLAFGGINGVNLFLPGELKACTRVPPVVISQVRVLDREMSPGIGRSGHLDLSHKENLVTFGFGVLDFTAPELNTCRYMLEGLDRDWVDAGARRYVSYAHLPPGEYRFRVQGRNSHGVWNRSGAAVSFTVIPPVWETVWFRILGFGAVLSLGVLFYSRRTARLEKERSAAAGFSRRLNEFQEGERRRVAGELHDGIGQSLLTIRNRLAQLPPTGGDPDHEESLRRIADDVQEAINDVRRISADLHPNLLDRLGLKRAIEAMIRSIAASARIGITPEIADIDALFTPAEAINVYRIIQEGVTNIVKHSCASEGRVVVAREGDCCRIIIADDGCGFDVRTLPLPTAGFGLPNMRERIRILRGELEIRSVPGYGTTLSLLVPVPHSRT